MVKEVKVWQRGGGEHIPSLVIGIVHQSVEKNDPEGHFYN